MGRHWEKAGRETRLATQETTSERARSNDPATHSAQAAVCCSRRCDEDPAETGLCFTSCARRRSARDRPRPRLLWLQLWHPALSAGVLLSTAGVLRAAAGSRRARQSTRVRRAGTAAARRATGQLVVLLPRGESLLSVRK